MAAYLSHLTYAASHRDAVIFLDVATDTYAVIEADAASLSPSDSRMIIVAHDEVLADLTAAGLTVDRPTRDSLRTKTAPDLRLPLPAAIGCVEVMDIAAFAGVLLWTVSTFRWRSLEALLRSAQSARPRRTCAPAKIIRLSRAFEVLMIWSPWQGRCLFRSLLLLRFVRARGGDALWVFGARTWPFLAHCWLQAGDVVLNDDPDRLLSFTSLLAI